MTRWRQSAYNRAVQKTLDFYEKWVLPDNETYGFPAENRRMSIREAKLKEFRKRKALLNPYEKNKLLENATDEEKSQLEKLAGTVNFKNCEHFTLSIDRHKDLYGNRVRNFPDEYEQWASIKDWHNDPYFSLKYKYKRINLKAWTLILLFGFAAIKVREAQVSEYDRLKRYEQRAMQNKEAEEVNGKRAQFVLFDKDGN